MAEDLEIGEIHVLIQGVEDILALIHVIEGRIHVHIPGIGEGQDHIQEIAGDLGPILEIE